MVFDAAYSEGSTALVITDPSKIGVGPITEFLVVQELASITRCAGRFASRIEVWHCSELCNAYGVRNG